jgi:hypothetical protein
MTDQPRNNTPPAPAPTPKPPPAGISFGRMLILAQRRFASTASTAG